MTDEGQDILERMRQLVEQSTWLVYFRETVPPLTMYRGTDPLTGRRVIIANPANREQILAALTLMNIPHDLAEPEEAPDGRS